MLHPRPPRTCRTDGYNRLSCARLTKTHVFFVQVKPPNINSEATNMSMQLFDGQRCNWSLPIIFLMSAPYVLPQSPRECSEHIRPLQALIASQNMLHWLTAHVCRAQHVMLLTYSSPNNLTSIMELYRNCEHNSVTHNQRTDTHVKVCTSFYIGASQPLLHNVHCMRSENEQCPTVDMNRVKHAATAATQKCGNGVPRRV